MTIFGVSFVYLAQWPQIVGTSIACIVVAYTFFRTTGKDSESPIAYGVSIPKQSNSDWKGEILDEPSIKVNYLDSDHSNTLMEDRFQAQAPFNVTARRMELFSGLSTLQLLMESTVPSTRRSLHRSIGRK